MKFNFTTYSSYSAILAGLSGLAYAYFFVIARDPFWSAVFLMLSGLFALKVAVYLYGKLEGVDKGFARIAAILLVVGSLGSLVHGGYDLANVLNPPSSVEDLPFPVNPRGLLSFGLTGLAIFKFSWLLSKDKGIPSILSLLGYLSGILLVVIYLGRLTVLSPANPMLLYPILLEGFVVNPIWYIWLGTVIAKR